MKSIDNPQVKPEGGRLQQLASQHPRSALVAPVYALPAEYSTFLPTIAPHRFSFAGM